MTAAIAHQNGWPLTTISTTTKTKLEIKTLISDSNCKDEREQAAKKFSYAVVFASALSIYGHGANFQQVRPVVSPRVTITAATSHSQDRKNQNAHVKTSYTHDVGTLNESSGKPSASNVLQEGYMSKEQLYRIENNLKLTINSAIAIMILALVASIVFGAFTPLLLIPGFISGIGVIGSCGIQLSKIDGRRKEPEFR